MHIEYKLVIEDSRKRVVFETGQPVLPGNLSHEQFLDTLRAFVLQAIINTENAGKG